MSLQNISLYHVYNQGNNKEQTFKDAEDYLLFLKKARALIKANCEILAYCLMPNHFHFIILTTETSVEKLKIGNIELTKITNAFRLLLSEYAVSFNKKYRRSGSLFRQKTKFELIDNGDPMYPKTAFKYVMVNPLKANFVVNLEDWPYSDFPDLIAKRSGTLCNLSLSKEIFQLTPVDLKDIASGVDDIPYLMR